MSVPTRQDSVAGASLIIAGAISIQLSAAIVEPAFKVLGPVATSSARFFLGALVLVITTRPSLRRWPRDRWVAVGAMGLSTAFMNVCFYQSIARIPLGAAVTIEFLGPLAVAVVGRKTWQHVSLALVGALGVVLLAHPGGGITLSGLLFGLGSGLGWAGYVFASHRVGGDGAGFGGLALAMSVSAIVTLPWTLSSARILVHHVGLDGRMLLVATMSIVVGFACEMQALRRLRPATVGVLLAMNPAIAFVVGWVTLGERLTLWVTLGMLCVVAAGVGVTLGTTGEAVVPQ